MDDHRGFRRSSAALWNYTDSHRKYTGNTVQQAAGENGCRQLPHLLDQSGGGEKEKWLSLEEYLPSVLAVQVSPDSEMEAIKAQAVIARTYIRQRIGEWIRKA